MTPQSQASPTKNGTTDHANTAGRWYLIVLGLTLALLGGAFVSLMARSFFRAREMRTWPEIACVILSSEVEQRQNDENSPAEYRQNLSFGYEWQGVAYTGDHLTMRGSPWSSNRGMIEERMASYPVGKKTTCRVDPTNPDLAILKPDSLAPGYSIWFPTLFIVGGLGITFRAAFAKKS